MKIKDGASFPHPVLQEYSDDYQTGSFDVAYSVNNKDNTIQYTVSLDELNIEDLINNKLAKIGVFITCEDTYHNKLVYLKNTKKPQSISYNPEEFKRVVYLRSIIFSTGIIKDYSPENLHDELADISWEFPAGELLAFGSKVQFPVRNTKLRPTETIFMFTVKNDMPEGELKINLEEDKVAIVINSKTHNKINEMRATSAGKKTLLSSVYLPVIMEVLYQLAEDSDAYEEKAWFKIFQDKCAHFGIDIKNPAPLRDAQKILKLPLLGLFDNMELMK